MGGGQRRRTGCWDGERRAYREFSTAAGRYFGWTDQWTTLGRPASWRNADLAGLEFVRRAGPQNLLNRQRGADMALQLAPEEPEAGPWRAELLSTFLAPITRREPGNRLARGTFGACRPDVVAVEDEHVRRQRLAATALMSVVVAGCEDDDFCFRDDVDEAVLVVDPP
jgi:hypothetical protein